MTIDWSELRILCVLVVAVLISPVVWTTIELICQAARRLYAG